MRLSDIGKWLFWIALFGMVAFLVASARAATGLPPHIMDAIRRVATKPSGAAAANVYWTDPILSAVRWTMNTNYIEPGDPTVSRIKPYDTLTGIETGRCTTSVVQRLSFTNSYGDVNYVIRLGEAEAGYPKTIIGSRGVTEPTYNTMAMTSNYTMLGWLYQTDPRTSSGQYYGFNLGFGYTFCEVVGVYQYKTILYDGNEFTQSAQRFPSNVWVHVAVVRSNLNVTVYTNGVVSIVTNNAPVRYSNTFFLVGAKAGASAVTVFPWRGRIDEATLYPTNLSQTQLQTHMLYSNPLDNKITPQGADL